MPFRLFLTVFLLLAISLPVSAGAAMYAYVDARGICHYTNVPGNGRYKLSERPPRRLGSPEQQLINTITRRSTSGLARAGGGGIGGYYRGGYGVYRTAPQTLNRYIQVAAMNHQVDPLLIKAVIKAESNFDPNALSPKGAQGLMQVIPKWHPDKIDVKSDKDTSTFSSLPPNGVRTFSISSRRWKRPLKNSSGPLCSKATALRTTLASSTSR